MFRNILNLLVIIHTLQYDEGQLAASESLSLFTSYFRLEIHIRLPFTVGLFYYAIKTRPTVCIV